MKQLTVPPGDDQERLDRFVARETGCARSEARRLIDAGLVRVGGRRARKGELLPAGATVELLEEPAVTPEARRPVPQPELPLTTLLVDEALVAMVKPFGMPSHPLEPGERDTLANALAARFPECAAASPDPREGGLAHRLDSATSGVILAARTPGDWHKLRQAFSRGEVHKTYLALVTGRPPASGQIDMPLHHAGRVVKPIPHGELNARTRFQLLKQGESLALLRVETETGRMHQVRAHLAFLGHPLQGDPLYGGPPAEGGHFLHAAEIRFPHPRSGVETLVKARLPPERVKILQQLLNWSED
jgi:23S rRNA pseudouridine1911/1915/1917 synthase